MRWLVKSIPILLSLSLTFSKINCEDRSVYREHVYRIERLKDVRAAHKEALINSIIHVESRGNPFAYNKEEEAVGILQIRPIMLNHANEIVGYKRFSLEDRWCPEKSKEIFWVVQNDGNPGMFLDQACHLWNAGIKDKRRWTITEGYRALVEAQYIKIVSSEVVVIVK